jgi:hypothetical protein
VILNINESANARSFNSANLVHQTEFDKVNKWIAESLKKAEINVEESNGSNKERLHNTITILGSRGSGKTSFLMSVLNQYETKEKENVEALPLIDPTLIEEKGHIFLTVLSQINKIVEKKIINNDFNPESKLFCLRKTWSDKMKKLAAGLPSIDGVGKQSLDDWEDPEFVMNNGLKGVQAAKELETNFHLLLKFALEEILHKKAFILAFDDIDIDFPKGWMVLETVRKYLTSPHIITLLSGDLRLFSKAIRKRQWSNFGKALLKNEGEQLAKMSEYNDLVTEMEGQYLQKVLRLERRVHLTTLLEKPNLDEIYINEEKGKNRIQDHYNTILQRFGICNPYQAEVYRSFLLGLPLRTQIQFVAALDKDNQADITDAFLSDLYEKQVDIDMARSVAKYLNIIILKLLIREKELVGAYQLQPSTTDNSLNACLLCLSLFFSRQSKSHTYLIFDNLLRIGYIRNITDNLPLDYQVEKDNSKKIPSLEGLVKHSLAYYDIVYKNMIGLITSYSLAFLNQNSVYSKAWGGFIPIYGLNELSKRSLNDAVGKIDGVFKNKEWYERILAFIPIISSNSDKNQNSFTSYSFYAILGSIGEIIKQKECAKEKEWNIWKTLNSLSQIRSYAMPDFNSKPMIQSESDVEDEELTVDEKTTQPDFADQFATQMNNWCNTTLTVSPHLLGKISTRLFNAFRNLEDSEKTESLGKAMHDRIIILFNTVLIEEVREKYKTVVLNNNNPRDTISIFQSNINNFIGQHKPDSSPYNLNELDLFKWLITCPLLLMYLDAANSDLRGIIEKIDSTEAIKNILCKSIFSSLNEVRIKGRKDFDGKIKFLYSKKTWATTLEHLRNNNISRDEFMTDDIPTLFEKLKRFFFNFGLDHITQARKNIEAKKIVW